MSNAAAIGQDKESLAKLPTVRVLFSSLVREGTPGRSWGSAHEPAGPHSLSALFYLIKGHTCEIRGVLALRKGRWPDSTQLSGIAEKHPVTLCVKVLAVPVSRQRKY